MKMVAPVTMGCGGDGAEEGRSNENVKDRKAQRMEAYWLREEGKEVDWARAEISALSLTAWGSDPKNRHS